MDLIRLAEAYAESEGISIARIATLAARDGKFFKRLAQGRSCTIRTYARVLQWFSGRWPTGTPWPSDIPRPAASPGSPSAEAASRKDAA